MKNARNRVAALKNGLWGEIDVQQVLFGYVSLFPDAQVIIYGPNGRGGVVQQAEPYGNGTEVLYLLQWKVLRHYDGLLLKN